MASSKRIVLTIQQRLDVLKDLETSSIANVAEKYNVHHTTIRRILEKAPEILKFTKKDKKEKRRQKIRKPMYEELEQQLLIWFTERKVMGDLISDALFLEKAVELKGEMGVSSHFKVSSGWLAKFKRRHGIRLVHVHNEKVSADKNTADTFVNDFKNLLNEKNIVLENVYNMDESELLWKALPVRTLVGKNEACISEQKMKKERITVGFCTNVTGTHKMMPLIINKFKKPKALRNIMDQLPVIFKAHPNAWMNQTLFVDWFDNYFKTAVRTFQQEKGFYGKVILVIDNCSSHQFPTTYIHDDYFEIIYLPPNYSSIQPMNQGIIEKTKRCFRHKLMQLVIQNGNEVEDFYKRYTLKDCIEIISKAWDEVTQDDIQNAWKKIIPPQQIKIEVGTEEEEKEKEEENIITEMRQTCTNFSEQNITAGDIEDYISACTAEENRYSREIEETVEGGGEHEDENMETETSEQTNEERDERRDEEKIEIWDEENIEERDEEKIEERDEYEAIGKWEIEKLEHGIELTREEREELEGAFKCLDRYKNRLPRSTQLIVEGMKLSFLGDAQQ